MTVTFCSSQDVIDRIGPGANAIILASGGIIERYITTAEGTICGETGIDWLTGYATVNTSVKETLKICTSANFAVLVDIGYEDNCW